MASSIRCRCSQFYLRLAKPITFNFNNCRKYSNAICESARSSGPHDNNSEFTSHGLHKKINQCWAVSLRIDGSVGATQVDKIYVMAKVINLDGSLELLFIGIGHQTERKAIGLKNAAMKAIESVIRSENKNTFLRKVSSVCTDGTNVNTGECNSLWTLLDSEIDEIKSEIPLIKVSWGDTGKNFYQVSKVLSIISSVSSYFHYSGLRTAELEQIAKENDLKINRLPKIFSIRWCEFSFNLLRSILVSWKALVFYFVRYTKVSDCNGFLQYLTHVSRFTMSSKRLKPSYTFGSLAMSWN